MDTSLEAIPMPPCHSTLLLHQLKASNNPSINKTKVRALFNHPIRLPLKAHIHNSHPSNTQRQAQDVNPFSYLQNEEKLEELNPPIIREEPLNINLRNHIISNNLITKPLFSAPIEPLLSIVPKSIPETLSPL